MTTEKLISLEKFCASHDIEISFIRSLRQTGLLEISITEDSGYIEVGQLKKLEQYLRFYYELDINLEGIEVVIHLLQKINSMQEEIISLRNRLRLYEPNE